LRDLIKAQINHITSVNESLLIGVTKGIERETLRCNADGTLATSNHPFSLGKPLTHKYITTDYSESLLELISPTFNDNNQLITFLSQLHYFVTTNIDDNLIWATSMPTSLPKDELIPIAQYGTSNQAKMKRIYREGLAQRYGKQMQMIAGVHYNISFPREILQSIVKFWDIKTKDIENYSYFATMRNFQRYSWMLIYLFGASPVIHKNFITNEDYNFSKLDDDFRYLKYATSLRMSDYGYQTQSQQGITINYNDIENYTENLLKAIKQTHLPYEKIGVFNNGVFQQLNDSLLQIENEFYNTIRPKRTCYYKEPQLSGLKKYGAEYIEVRCLDCNPFSAIGIDKDTILFLDIFLLFCALGDNSLLSSTELEKCNNNFQQVAHEGRNPNLELSDGNSKVNLKTWALDIIEALYPIAEALDIQSNTQEYTAAIEIQKQKIQNPELTPSAMLINKAQQAKMKYNDYILTISKQHQKQLKKISENKDLMLSFKKSTENSIIQYQEIEYAKQINFLEYRKEYFKQYR
jgi:glutamate--cysteine ligase